VLGASRVLRSDSEGNQMIVLPQRDDVSTRSPTTEPGCLGQRYLGTRSSRPGANSLGAAAGAAVIVGSGRFALTGVTFGASRAQALIATLTQIARIAITIDGLSHQDG
jgi:hypothetical protein